MDPANNLQETHRREGLAKLYHDCDATKIQTLGNSTGEVTQGLQQIKPKGKKGIEGLQQIKRDLQDITNIFLIDKCRNVYLDNQNLHSRKRLQ